MEATERIYQLDAYVKEFSTQVLERDADYVLLARTAFYPGGGGQPADQGSLLWEAIRRPVAGFRTSGAEVWHQLTDDLPEPGQEVQGVLEWGRRHELMRTHTAMHILCGVVWRDYGAQVTGGNMEPLRGRMDFEFPHLSQDLVKEIEWKVQDEVRADRRVVVRILPREEAFQIPDLIRTKINLLPADLQQVRVVEIVGLDLQADGGTHVASTGEVGEVRIVDYKSKGASNKRLVVALGEVGEGV
ncbi:MAG: alanyl-tRNA editing protein [Anaerolineales bacterium]